MLDKTKKIIEELKNKKVVFICTSQFANFYSLQSQIIKELKENFIRIRIRTKSGTVANCSNSDGDGARDEFWTENIYYATQF